MVMSKEKPIKYECLHCGAKNPKYLAYRNEGNACAKCKKKVNYYVVYDNERTGQTSKLSIGLTKEGAVEFAKKRGCLYLYHNLRIISFDKFEYKVLFDTISSIKKKIELNKEELVELKAKLRVKEIEIKQHKVKNG